ncbi:MAG: NPXTG-anchored protein [Ruminococcus sp.]|nr:NPXTG-anchored protein [Ruminococcus sp.]
MRENRRKSRKNKAFVRLAAAAAAVSMAAVPVPAFADGGGEKTVSSVSDNNVNPSTGAFTLAGVSVILAGASVIVFKKRK